MRQTDTPVTALQLLPRFLDGLLCASPAVVYATGPDWRQGRLHYLGANGQSLCGLERETLHASPQRWLILLSDDSLRRRTA